MEKGKSIPIVQPGTALQSTTAAALPHTVKAHFSTSETLAATPRGMQPPLMASTSRSHSY